MHFSTLLLMPAHTKCQCFTVITRSAAFTQAFVLLWQGALEAGAILISINKGGSIKWDSGVSSSTLEVSWARQGFLHSARAGDDLFCSGQPDFYYCSSTAVVQHCLAVLPFQVFQIAPVWQAQTRSRMRGKLQLQILPTSTQSQQGLYLSATKYGNLFTSSDGNELWFRA